jgi:hypothetical protein
MNACFNEVVVTACAGTRIPRIPAIAVLFAARMIWLGLLGFHKSRATVSGLRDTSRRRRGHDWSKTRRRGRADAPGRLDVDHIIGNPHQIRFRIEQQSIRELFGSHLTEEPRQCIPRWFLRRCKVNSVSGPKRKRPYHDSQTSGHVDRIEDRLRCVGHRSLAARDRHKSGHR